jgi:predicted PurR-regulated permease PerM
MAKGDEGWQEGRERLRRWGLRAWWVLGIAGVVVLVGCLISLLSLVLIPVVLALFPATLLLPVARWLKDRGLPDALAALVALLGGILLIVAVIGTMIPLVTAELPELTESASEGVAELERFLAEGPLGIEVDGVSGLLERAADQFGGDSGDGDGDEEGQAAEAAVNAFEVIAGFLLMLVLLFFYLRDEARLGRGILDWVPARARPHVRDLGVRIWSTVGPYFRGQLLVALVDAVFIGAGLLLLRIPLAVPLAVLIFFGGMFPIVGAVTTGVLAVLVAFADSGLGTAAVVMLLVLAVQQLESNVLEPFILGRVVHLHPLVVLLSITAGAVLLGILGAFLAVPVATVVANTLEAARERSGAERPSEA